MKPHFFLLALLLQPLLHAKDPHWADPLAVDSDARMLKPHRGEIEDCTLEPLTYDSSRHREDPLGTRERKECDAFPEKCVITTYSIPEPGGPDDSLSNIKTIIDYDPRTGEGKVYEANMFGKTLNGQVGVVKKESYSGNLIVYPASHFGNADYSKPIQVIEGVERLVSGSGFRGCERRDGIPQTTYSKAKIYQADELGSRNLFADPIGNAEIECQK